MISSFVCAVLLKIQADRSGGVSDNGRDATPQPDARYSQFTAVRDKASSERRDGTLRSVVSRVQSDF